LPDLLGARDPTDAFHSCQRVGVQVELGSLLGGVEQVLCVTDEVGPQSARRLAAERLTASVKLGEDRDDGRRV